MALGLHLIFMAIPQKLKGSRLHISGRIIGAAMTVLPLASFVFNLFNMRSCGPSYATAVNLTSYCLTSTLIAMAYYVLLDKTNDRIFLNIHLVLGISHPFPLWIGLCFGSEFVARHMIIVAYTLFCVLAVIHISTCFYFYRQELINSRKGETKLNEAELKLIGRTIYVSMSLIFIGFISASSSLYPLWLGMIFIACFIGGAIYIYICYHKAISYIINSFINPEAEVLDLQPDLPEEEEETILTTATINDDIKAHIEKQLQKWINKKGYLQSDASINAVAKAVYTNRTYLSKYINSVYGCSFKTWITQLRIEEAKKLMQSNPQLSISDIATETGFTSVASFSHIFTRYEGTSPSKWREKSSI